MVILEVFTKNINVTYKATLLSKAAVLTLIFGIITVVLPFILAYKSKGFWIKRDVLYEQPDVKFKGEYIFLATTNNPHRPLITCSTIPHYEKRFDNLDDCSLIKIQETDKDFDSKVEEFNFNLQVNLPADTRLTFFYIIIPLDYKLHVCPLHMQSAAIYQTFLPIALSKYIIMSDILVTQSSPLVCHSKKINTSYNYSLTSIDVQSDDINIIIKEHSLRNISTTMKNVYISFIPGNIRYFSLDVTIQYPEDKIYYEPGFWQIVKWAWIQYLSIYLIISWLISKIKSYIFTRRLVLFYEDNPLKKKQ